MNEHCNYCEKETETIDVAGGDCAVCGFSKVTPTTPMIKVKSVMLINIDKDNLCIGKDQWIAHRDKGDYLECSLLNMEPTCFQKVFIKDWNEHNVCKWIMEVLTTDGKKYYFLGEL